METREHIFPPLTEGMGSCTPSPWPGIEASLPSLTNSGVLFGQLQAQMTCARTSDVLSGVNILIWLESEALLAIPKPRRLGACMLISGCCMLRSKESGAG